MKLRNREIDRLLKQITTDSTILISKLIQKSFKNDIKLASIDKKEMTYIKRGSENQSVKGRQSDLPVKTVAEDKCKS